jgi:hypothetical protein
MPPSRPRSSARRATLDLPAARDVLTRSPPRRDGRSRGDGATRAFPFYPFAHSPLLRTSSYGQRCVWRLSYPSLN